MRPHAVASAATVALLLVLCTAPAQAQVSLSPGIGVGALLTPGSATSRGSTGVVLELLGEHRVDGTLGFRVRLGWGLTRFDRTLAAIEFANGLAALTAKGYAGVTHWVLHEEPRSLILKLLGATFAYSLLLVGFAASGALYVLSPLLATSFLELGMTAVATLTLGAVGLSVEGGLGTLLHTPPSLARFVPGVGPQVGLALRVGRLRVALHALWSPPLLQGGDPAARGNAIAGGLTAGVAL